MCDIRRSLQISHNYNETIPVLKYFTRSYVPNDREFSYSFPYNSYDDDIKKNHINNFII